MWRFKKIREKSEVTCKQPSIGETPSTRSLYVVFEAGSLVALAAATLVRHAKCTSTSCLKDYNPKLKTLSSKTKELKFRDKKPTALPVFSFVTYTFQLEALLLYGPACSDHDRAFLKKLTQWLTTLVVFGYRRPSCE